MSITKGFANDIHKLILTGVGITGIADNAGSSPLTKFYVSLHTGDPGEGGTQSTDEVAYTGYAREELPRAPAAWDITDNVAKTEDPIEFGKCTNVAGMPEITHIGIGTGENGAGKLLFRLALVGNTIKINAGTTPRIEADTELKILTS